MAIYDGNNLSGAEVFAVGDIINFEYSGSPKEIPLNNTVVQLEAYGAEGGYINASTRARGGYVKGSVVLAGQNTLTVVVGGKGTATGGHATQPAGYNGGAAITSIDSDGNTRGATGGGASHIALSNRGELKEYANYKSEILLVAGGGGGSGHNAVLTGRGQPYPKGGVGGVIGGNAYTYKNDVGSNLGAYGSTVSDPGALVITNGNYAKQGTFGTSVAGLTSSGGGGFFGGSCTPYAGAGGSSYFECTVYDRDDDTGVREGNGFVRITILETEISNGHEYTDIDDSSHIILVRGDKIHFTCQQRALALTLYRGIYGYVLKGGDAGRSLNNDVPTTWGGSGGITWGTFEIKKTTRLYFTVGGLGSDGKNSKMAPGGFNGGGQGKDDGSDNEAGGAGGGCSDISFNWLGDLSEPDNQPHINTRLAVAGAGGGAIWNVITCQTGNYHGGNTVGLNDTWKGQDGYKNTDSNGAGGGGAGYLGGLANSSSSNYAARGGSSYVEQDILSVNSNFNSFIGDIISGKWDITHSNGYIDLYCLVSYALPKFLVCVTPK